MCGTINLTFHLEWTPGGDNPQLAATTEAKPWWASPSPDHPPTLENGPSIPLQYPYTLIPLRFFAPPLSEKAWEPHKRI